MSTKTLKVAEAGQREAAPLEHLNLPDDLFDREEPEQASIKAGSDSNSRPVSIDRGMPISPDFLEPLPDDLLAAFEGDGEAT